MKHFILLFFILTFCTTQAQVVLKGRVFDNTKQPIDHATVIIEDLNTKAVIAYELVDEKGRFELALRSKESEVNIRVNALNFLSQTKQIANESQEFAFELVPEATQLEEIFVKASAITQHNDTIVFDLKAFAGKNDRVLEDVLKKMPGIEVSEEGQIKYQGKEINKFYVEGKDLMGGRYSSITKALPNLHVDKLEVLENHQPIKMLENRIASESPAINIRLKDKVSFSGSGRAGVGADPFLWNTSLSPMFLSKGLQYLFNYEANNTGNNISNKLQDFSIVGSYDTYSYSKSIGTTLYMAETTIPSIDQSRYLFNKSHLVSANFLTKLTEKLEMRTNVYYYNNEIERTGEEYTEVKNITEDNSDQVIRYSRKNNSFLFEENFKSVFNFTKNTEDNFFKDYVTISLNRSKNRGELLLNTDPIYQSVQSPSFSLQNSMSTLIPVGRNKFINFKSLVDFTRDKQDYDATSISTLNFPDEALKQYESLEQEYMDNTFYTNNAFSISWKVKKWTISEEYSLVYENRKVETDLYGWQQNKENVGNQYQNDLNYDRFNNVLRTGVSYKGTKLDMSFNLPIVWNTFSLNNRVIDEKTTKNKVNLTPSFYTSYKLSPMWTIRGSTSQSTSYTPLSQLYPNFIFRGLDFIAFKNKIEDTKSFSSRIAFEFKNPFNGLFANGNIGYTKIDYKVLFSTHIDDNGQQVIEAIEKKNTNFSHMANLNVGKFLSKLSMNVKGMFSFNRNKSEVLINRVLRDVNMYNYNYGLQISNNHFDWVNFTYDFNYGKQERKEELTSVYSYSTSHNVRFDIIPFKTQSFVWKLDYRENTFDKQTFSNRFMDLMYRFKWNKKKIDFDIEWRNILNTKEYEQVIVNNIQTARTGFKLRPTQVLASVRFNF